MGAVAMLTFNHFLVMENRRGKNHNFFGLVL